MLHFFPGPPVKTSSRKWDHFKRGRNKKWKYCIFLFYTWC